MIPIGGKAIHNTMDEDEALEAVRIMNPAVILHDAESIEL